MLKRVILTVCSFNEDTTRDESEERHPEDLPLVVRHVMLEDVPVPLAFGLRRLTCLGPHVHL